MIFFYESEISEMPGRSSTLPVRGEVVKQQPLLTFVKVYQQAAIRCMGLYYPAMWWLQQTLMQTMQTNKCNSFCREDFEYCSFGWINCSPWQFQLRRRCQNYGHALVCWCGHAKVIIIFPTFSPDSSPVNHSQPDLFAHPKYPVLAARCFLLRASNLSIIPAPGGSIIPGVP